ncbi:MAG: O-antigen ligase family protein [Solirubrobacterales bacterium]
MPNTPITTALSWTTAPRRGAELARTAAFALAVLALEIVLAHGVVGPQISKVVFLFIGVLCIALVFRFPLATAMVVVFLTDFVFYPTYFAHQVGPISVRPHELALACLLAVAILRPKRRTWGGTPGAALLIFYAMLILSALVAVSSGTTSLSDAFNFGRGLFQLSLFFAIVRLFPEPAERRALLTGAAVIAAATGVIAALTAFGAGFGDALQAAGSQTIKAENGTEGIDRVRLPGLSAGYALFWYAAIQIISRRRGNRAFWWAILAGITIDIIVSFNRNMWLGVILGFLLVLLYGGVKVRGRLTTAAGVLVAAAVLFAVFGSSTSNDSVVSPIVKRGETIVNPAKTSKENSLQLRFEETSKAWKTARSHLLLGVGSGAPFGVTDKELVTSGNLVTGERPQPQLFLHNQYLFLILISGVPGLIAFLVFLIGPVSDAFKRRPRDPPILACGIGIVLIMISAVIAIYFTVEDMTTVLGLLTGVIVADREGRAADARGSGLLA